MAKVTARRLVSGPVMTIRPTVVYDTWKFRLRMKGTPHEALCHLCTDEGAGDRERDFGPDTRESCERWATKHLRVAHGVPVAGSYSVESGQEMWL